MYRLCGHIFSVLLDVAQWVKNLQWLRLCGGVGSIPGPAQWVKGSGVATAVAQIQSLAWELSYAMGAAIGEKKSLCQNILTSATACWPLLIVIFHSGWDIGSKDDECFCLKNWIFSYDVSKLWINFNSSVLGGFLWHHFSRGKGRCWSCHAK